LAADPTRHRILSLLKGDGASVKALTARLGVRQPTVTHHLKKLEDAGLVRMEKRGREHWYFLEAHSECFVECGLLEGLK
jgi:ArsR family transcriptional regulator